MDDAQREIVAFLRDPSSYPPGAGPVEVIETHASLVFLAGKRAYKLKRAVKYPYLDFSTPALRLAACTTELKLNRRTAPQLYLEVRAISRGPDGTIERIKPGDEEEGWRLVSVAIDGLTFERNKERRVLMLVKTAPVAHPGHAGAAGASNTANMSDPSSSSSDSSDSSDSDDSDDKSDGDN